MEQFYKFPIPVGYSGLIGNQRQDLVKPSNLITATNISYRDGTIRLVGGSSLYNSTPISGSPIIFGGYDWWPTTTAQRMVVYTSAGNLLKDSGTGTFSTTLASGLTGGSIVPVFVSGGAESISRNRKLFVFNGSNTVQVLSGDGATTSNIATPPADWSGVNQPSCACIHEGRLWAAGNFNAPHTLYYSSLTDHENFTAADAGILNCYPGDGGTGITALVSFKGMLIVFKKPFGIYGIITTPDVSAFVVKVLSSSMGIAGPQAFCVIDNDILFMDSSANFQLLSGVSEFGGVANSNLSQAAALQTFVNNTFNLSQLNNVRAIYFPNGREALFSIYNPNGTNWILSWDFNVGGGLPRPKLNTKDDARCLFLRRDSNSIPQPYSGDAAGSIWYIDNQTIKTVNGNPYTAEFTTPSFNFGYVDPRIEPLIKLGKFLELEYFPVIGGSTITVQVFWDGKLTQTMSVSLPGVSSGSTLGSFVLDTNVFSADPVIPILSIRKRLIGRGKTLSLKFNNSNGTDFSVLKAFVHCGIGTESKSPVAVSGSSGGAGMSGV